MSLVSHIDESMDFGLTRPEYNTIKARMRGGINSAMSNAEIVRGFLRSKRRFSKHEKQEMHDHLMEASRQYGNAEGASILMPVGQMTGYWNKEIQKAALVILAANNEFRKKIK